MKINISLLKNSIIYVFITLLVITLLVFANDILYKPEVVLTKLEDEKIDTDKLIISEVMSSNKGVYIDENGDCFDYVEIYNGSNKDINLLNYGLSDREDGKIKWLFPDVTIKSNSYVVVYLVGEKKDGLYASFALKEEGGELLSLKKPSGKVIDAVKLVSMSKNNSMSRVSNGDWIVTDMITPGYDNTEKGREQFLMGMKNIDNDGLYISEVLPSNEGNVIFENDKLYSYVEITNGTDEDINLNNYYLSNDEKLLYKFRLPDYVIKPNTSYVIYMNGLGKDNNSSFDIKHKNGEVFLSNKNGIVDNIKYEELTNGVAYVKFEDKWYRSANISPGEVNTTLGKIEYQKELDKAPKDIIISEVMNSNYSYLPQNGNQYYDWIELYNNSDKDIDLSKYSIANDKDDPNMFKFSNVTLKSGSYYILMASGNTNLSNKSYEHINFKLSSATGLLLYKEDKLIDSMYLYEIPRGNSYGRNTEYGHYFYQKPTPGAKNDINGVKEVSIKPSISKSGGVYNVEKLELAMEGLGDIYYTLDGTNPTNKSTKYTGPITLNKTTIVKMVTYENGKKSSDVISNSYVINEKHDLPILSISVDTNSFNNLNKNVWSNKVIKAHADFYEDGGSFSQDCGLKLFGGDSRSLKKKSYALKFNSTYSHTLNYKMFDNKDIVEFNTLVLRSGSQEQASSMIRDEFVSTMVINYMDLDAQGVKPVVLYINGNYYGVYFIREKIDDKFIERNHNVTGGTNLINAFTYTAEEGSNKDFVSLRSYAKNNDLTTKEAYDYINSKLDVDNYIDYYILQYVTCNYDLQNIRMYNNKKIDNGKIKLIVYDNDYALRTDSGAYFMDYLLNPYFLKPLPDMSLLDGMIKNKDFRKRFLERISYFYKNVWTKEHINKTYDYLYNSIEKEMVRDAARWGNNYNTFKSSANSMKNIALNKVNRIPSYTRTYFKLTQEEYNEYFK